jgi:cyclohexanecarboxylate-CoA ligase
VALTKLGATVNPIIPIYTEREVKFILGQAGSVAIVIPDVFRGVHYPEMISGIKPDLPQLKHVIVLGETIPGGTIDFSELMKGDGSSPSLEKVDANDVKLLVYTSGTTAEPKGVQHTHNTLVCTALNDTSFMGLDENTVIFMPSPVTHITGYALALEYPFIVGLRTVLLDVWAPERGLDLLEQEKCTYTTGATPFLQQMIHSPAMESRRIPSSFTFLCGGAYIPPELIREAWNKAGWKTFRCYGSTEAPTITLGRGAMEKAAETDGFIVNYDVKVVDFDGKPLPSGKDGEIVVKGPKLFVGYRDPALNVEAFDEEGWFRTGDLGRMSPDGYLQITGRKKDIIIRGGENISAAEIEDILHLHPSVETAAAVSMPDVNLGEKVCVYVKLNKGKELEFQQMIDFLKQKKLAKQKWPERLEIIGELPMTASGKIKKHLLRKDIAHKLGLPPVR